MAEADPPSRILPDSAPGGVVLHIYAPDTGELAVVRHLVPGTPADELEAMAASDRRAAVNGALIVAYDGDTGWAWDAHVIAAFIDDWLGPVV